MPGLSNAKEPPSDASRYFLERCAESVTDLYTDTELEPLFPSVPDAVSTTCACVNSTIASDTRLLTSFEKLGAGNLSEAESKKLGALVAGRFFIGVMSCMIIDVDRASRGIGPRGVV